MSLNADKNSIKMKIRDVENVFRYRRIPYPKRSVELIALIAISCTFFLFMHTKNLNTRLREMEVKLQPSEFSALGLTGEHHASGGDSRHQNDINTLHGTYQYLKSTGQIHTLVPGLLNNTKKAEVDILFFNRVPKVGSQSLMELMKRLAKLNGYTAHRDKPKELETILVSPNKQFEIADEIMELKEPAAYSKHVAHLNFTELDYPKPIYINLVRDPVERIVSWFYYIRAPWYIADRKKHFPDIELPSIEWLKKDFASCIRSNDPECVFEQDTKRFLSDHRRQMLFFCGQEDSVCMPFNSYHAMQRAKRNVEKDYAVVGSWDDTNVTLAVFEKYIPRFFKNAPEVYHNHLNNTKKADINIIVFNRPAKVGSQSLMQLMTQLGKINNYIATRDKGKPHETVLLGPLQQEKLATEIIYSRPPPYAYSQHLAYLNFTELGLPKPIYINLVRDPIERVISWHYYVRAPWYYDDLEKKLGDRALPRPGKEFMEMDLETCVKMNNIHCQFTQGETKNKVGDHRSQMLFFCGQDKAACLPFNSESALQQAKRTVEQDYAVVGAWEDTNITLTVFEAYIPRFFKHAKIAFYLGHEKLSSVNKNRMKKEVSDEVRDILKKNFTREIEFYEFCKQRLYRQYAAINTKLDDDDYMLLPDS